MPLPTTPNSIVRLHLRAVVLGAVVLSLTFNTVVLAHPPAPQPQGKTNPPVRVTISKKTTWITAPLRADGYPDYVRYLNEKLSEGVTPENNAAVLYVRAFGAAKLPEEGRERFFKALGIEPLPDEGDFFINWFDFARQLPENQLPPRKNAEETARDALIDQLFVAAERPWTADEFPHVARYLNASEGPLRLIAEGSRRPQRFLPRVSRSPESHFTDLLVSHIGEMRDATRALAGRAMLHLGKGDRAAAWRDAHTIHLIADQLYGGPEIDHLIGIGFDSLAWQVDTELLRDPALDRRLARTILDDVNFFPFRRETIARLVNYQRLVALDAVCVVSRTTPEGLGVLIDPPDFSMLLNDGPLPAPVKDTLLTKFHRWQRQRLIESVHQRCDWNVPLRELNTVFDELEKALAKDDWQARNEALQKVIARAEQAQESARGLDWKTVLVEPHHATSHRIGDLFVGMFVPAMKVMLIAGDRFTTQRRLIQVAAAIAAYRAERGEYPEKLNDLAPAYVTTIRVDAYDRQLVYRKSNDEDSKSYVLYSLGENGTDDGGAHCRDNNNDCFLDIRFDANWSRFPESP